MFYLVESSVNRASLLDLHLPDIIGHEVLQQLKAHGQTADIPVVVVSANMTASQMERLRAVGAAAHLTKPFNIAEFLQTIDSLLSLRIITSDGSGLNQS